MPGKQESLLNRHMGICSHRVKILAKTEVYMYIYIYIFFFKKTPRKENAVFLYISELRNKP